MHQMHIEWMSLNDDSHELSLTCTAVADSRVSAEIGNFLLFRTTTACGSNMHQMHIEQMSPKDVKVSVKTIGNIELETFFSESRW